jgi:hypothetical protein
LQKVFETQPDLKTAPARQRDITFVPFFITKPIAVGLGCDNRRMNNSYPAQRPALFQVFATLNRLPAQELNDAKYQAQLRGRYSGLAVQQVYLSNYAPAKCARRVVAWDPGRRRSS